MTDRDRLAADLHSAICDYHWPDLLTCGIDHADDADRLIALGWTRGGESAWDYMERMGLPQTDGRISAADLRGIVTDPAWAEGHHRGDDIDEERLARALMEVAPDMKVTGQGRAFIRPSAAEALAAAIAKAYREDTDATD